MTFAGLLRKSCQNYRHDVAVTCAGQDQTYAQLWERSCRVADALLGLGVRPGDRVAVLADNQLEFVEQATGLALAGLVRSPMYTMNAPSVHAYMLNLIGARVCIVQDKYAKDIASIRDDVPTLEHLVVVGDPTGLPDIVSYSALLDAAGTDDPKVRVADDDDHIIRFSAGTTGKPKGILHSQRGWLAMGNEFALALPRIDEGDAWLVASPLSHAAGLSMWNVIAHGARWVILPGFDPALYLDTIEAERCAYAAMVPTMVHMLTEVPGAHDRDLSSLKAVTYGASPITERALRAGLGLWGNVMYQFYGQSEALPGTVLAPRHHILDRTERERGYLRSAGRPTPNSVVTIRDDDGNVLPAGEVGEICIDTPGAMKAIWDDPEASATRVTDDGAVRTRDMGYLDEDGFVFLVDRKEDLIISGGYDIWPLEVEQAIAAHPAVREVAVVGVPDDKWGESIFAAVTLDDGRHASEQELIGWARDRVGSVKKPRYVHIAAEPLPKSPVGKILRRQVRDKYWTDQSTREDATS